MAPPRIYCCSFGCLNSAVKRPEMSFFKLPREEDRKKEWLRLLSREDLNDKRSKSYVVCEEHFQPHEILRAEHRKNLKKNVLPSLNLPHIMTKDVVAFSMKMNLEVGTQTDEITPATKNAMAQRRKLKLKQIRQAKLMKTKDIDEQTLNQQKEVFYKLCDKFLPDELSALAKSQASSHNAKTTLSLPVTTEIDDKIMAMLQVKIDHMTEEEKNCAIIVDTLDLKVNLTYNAREDKIVGFHEVDGVQTAEPATVAMVLMLRGIVVNWQQVLGYALLSEYRNYEEITKWIDKIVGILLDMRLNIRTFISDMGTDVYNLAKERPFCSERPFYSHRRKKMFYIYDTPSLMKMFRDSFLENEFYFKGLVANSQAIQQFYHQDSEKSSRLAPKLSRRHINPSCEDKGELRLAVQLLSNSVAAGILTYIDFYVIDESGRDTVQLIKLMNDLFDLLNSINEKDDNVLKRAFSGDPDQLRVFNEAISFFRTLKIVNPQGKDITSSSKFIEGFQVTISSVMLMLEDLGRKGIKILRTRRLNKGTIEKFFEELKSSIGVIGDPSSRQFMTGFRELLVRDLMKPTAGKDCTMKLLKLLTPVDMSSPNEAVDEPEDDSEEPNVTSSFTIDESENNVTVKSSEYNQLEIPDKNTFVYLSSYLLNKCSEKHKGCEILKSYIAPAPEQRIHNFGADVRYQRYREYSQETCSSLLVVPYDDFIKYVEAMEELFRSCFKKKHICKNIAATLYQEISGLSFAPPCPCFPMVYLKKLFIRMRIFQTIQFNNKQLRVGGSKRRYFTVPDL